MSGQRAPMRGDGAGMEPDGSAMTSGDGAGMGSGGSAMTSGDGTGMGSGGSSMGSDDLPLFPDGLPSDGGSHSATDDSPSNLSSASFGSKNLLVFLHSLEQNPTAWQDQVTAMPSSIRAVAPWLKGLRPDQQGSFSLDAAADEVLSQLNVYGADQMQLCGLSMGAAVALATAIRSPQNVSHLVLVNGLVYLPKLAVKAQGFALRMIPEKTLREKSVSKQKALSAVNYLSQIDFRTGLGKVTAKTLIVAGGKDKGHQSNLLAHGIPDARLEVIPDAGHFAPMEYPEQFNALLYDFLGS